MNKKEWKNMQRLILGAITLLAWMPLAGQPQREDAAIAADVVIDKPVMRWLWGGFGFHNSEATMTPMMSEEFRDQRVLKTFRELSPTYSRVFAGYWDWTQEAMDRFADYYDATFRQAGTTLYLAPGRMPTITEDFDPDAYAEAVASRLEYLVKKRKCVKIRYYTASNELSVGSTYAWFLSHWDVYVKVMKSLHRAFARHGLDIGLMSSDASGFNNLKTIDWSIRDLNDVTDTYCWHLYSKPVGMPGCPEIGDPEMYKELYGALTNYVRICLGKEKRLSLGEFGVSAKKDFHKGPMCNDCGTGFNYSAAGAGLAAMQRVEMGLCAMNAGCVSAASWTFCDYPDPFLREDGDTPEEKKRYEVARFSGHGLNIRYNKWGLFRWDDENHDYSSYPDLYAMGYLVKLFRKGARVLVSTTRDPSLRVGAVTNPDGSCSIIVINWGERKNVRVANAHNVDRPYRRYVYDSANPPFNAFNDLQPMSGTVEAKEGLVAVELPAKSITFLTTDYEDRVPAAVKGVKVADGRLTWEPVDDPDHCYYRVYANGRQIASTVATSLSVNKDDVSSFTVKSVDKWGNEGK
jgi:hypothetical protein